MSETSLSALLPPLRILILGYGNVTRAFLPLLASRSEWLGRELGLRPVIMGLGSRRQGLYIHPDGVNANSFADEQDPLRWFKSEGTSVNNAEQFIEGGKAAGASLFIELTTLDPLDGQPALMHIRKALEAGMNVVTANKGPVAYAQSELEALANRHDAQFRFESAVMDGLPLLNLAEFTLPAAGIRAFRGLLNATSSLVLSMIEQGYTQEDAIRKAQQVGVAEADPWYDLDGWDAVMKTTIVANSLMEGELTPHMVEREGIRNLTSDDICAAALAGSPYRLVSEAHRKHGMLMANVRPVRISAEDTLHAGTRGMTGVISLETDAMGIITLIEHTPTVQQTAYGVLSDLIIIQRSKLKM
jgi:homoserine dehydrogenase